MAFKQLSACRFLKLFIFLAYLSYTNAYAEDLSPLRGVWTNDNSSIFGEGWHSEVCRFFSSGDYACSVMPSDGNSSVKFQGKWRFEGTTLKVTRRAGSLESFNVEKLDSGNLILLDKNGKKHIFVRSDECGVIKDC